MIDYPTFPVAELAEDTPELLELIATSKKVAAELHSRGVVILSGRDQLSEHIHFQETLSRHKIELLVVPEERKTINLEDLIKTIALQKIPLAMLKNPSVGKPKKIRGRNVWLSRKRNGTRPCLKRT